MAPRVLIAAHNHPSLHPGGTEIFAHDLFRAYQRAGCEAMFMGATNKVHREARPGTSFQSIGNGGDEILLWSGHFDRFYMSQIDLYGIVPDIVELLRDFRPDVVHLHHLLLLGAEFPHIVRRTLPDCRIVLTLHDYYPICHHDGLMVRTTGKELCHGASPDRCHACFKDIALDKFVLRERHIKSLLSAVDAFVSPSEFLKQRYVEWGLAEDRIEVIPNGSPNGQQSNFDSRSGQSRPSAISAISIHGRAQQSCLRRPNNSFPKALISSCVFTEQHLFRAKALSTKSTSFLRIHGRSCSVAALIAAKTSLNSSSLSIAQSCPRSGGRMHRSSFRKHRDRTALSFAAILAEWPR